MDYRVPQAYQGFRRRSDLARRVCERQQAVAQCVPRQPWLQVGSQGRFRLSRFARKSSELGRSELLDSLSLALRVLRRAIIFDKIILVIGEYERDHGFFLPNPVSIN